MFDNNFGKFGDRFTRFFHQVIRKKIFYIHVRDFHFACNLLLHYLVKVENPNK